MIILTGKNSLFELFFLSKDRLNFFDKIAKEFDLEYYIKFKAFNDKDVEATIKYSSNTYDCKFHLTQRDFRYNIDGLFSDELKEIIEGESNQKELDETLEHLRHKMSIILDFLEFEKNLNISEISVFFDSDSYKNITFYLNETGDRPFNMCINNDLHNYECDFRGCDIKDIEYIMNNYKMEENTKILLENSIGVFKTKENTFSEYNNVVETKKAVLKFIDDFKKGINNDSFNR